MRLAVSNIAWPIEADADVANLLISKGIRAIEVAPTKPFPLPLDATLESIQAYRQFWDERGIQIVAAQALLFGRPELTLFETPVAMLDYLAEMVRICAELGAGPLVFGSPKNRRRGVRTAAEVEVEAVTFFRALGEIAQDFDTVIGIEANPPAYGADYLTTAAEALALTRTIDHPGVMLHLDSACMTMANDPVTDTIRVGAPYLTHFHASEPQLATLGSGGVDHATCARALREIGYTGYVSAEMRANEPFDLAQFGAAVDVLVQFYG